MCCVALQEGLMGEDEILLIGCFQKCSLLSLVSSVWPTTALTLFDRAFIWLIDCDLSMHIWTSSHLSIHLLIIWNVFRSFTLSNIKFPWYTENIPLQNNQKKFFVKCSTFNMVVFKAFIETQWLLKPRWAAEAEVLIHQAAVHCYIY